ncbi:MAG: M23 family metallopeptidase [bacterium]
MTPTTRSTLKLDLKDLSPKPSTPHIGRIGLVVVSAVAIVSTIASIDNPSASTTNLDQLDRVHTSDLFLDPEQFEQNAVVQQRPSLQKTAGSDHSSQPSISQTRQLSSHHRKEIKLAMMTPTLTRRYSTPAVSMNEAEPVSSITTNDMVGIESNLNGFNTQLASVEPDILASGKNPESQNRTRNNNPVETILSSIFNSEEGSDTQADADLGNFEALIDIDADAINSLVIDASSTDNESSETETSGSLFKEEDWKSEKVKKRDTLSQIFNRLGLSSKEAYELVALEQASPLKLIRPGQKIEVVTTPSSEQEGEIELAALRYALDKFSSLVALRTDQGYQIETVVKEPEVQHRVAKATIDHSLLGSAKSADIPHDIVYQLAGILGWQIDFARDIQPGDQIAIIYEELYLDEELVGHGQIIAAEFLGEDKQYRAIRHVDEEGHVTYFAPDGDGIQGSFLRSPLKFARVTSKFSKKRFHPIQKKWKAHKGVDYGAPMKTPIMSTGDGIVTLAGRKKGYGKTVIIRHGHKYQTLYAHMNSYAKGLKAGVRVKQGDVIGYVGKTGWTTGPHLHYEFRLNGVHQNPLTVELPKSAPIDQKYQQAFKQEAEVWVAALNKAGRIPLAQNDF